MARAFVVFLTAYARKQSSSVAIRSDRIVQSNPTEILAESLGFSSVDHFGEILPYRSTPEEPNDYRNESNQHPLFGLERRGQIYGLHSLIFDDSARLSGQN